MKHVTATTLFALALSATLPLPVQAQLQNISSSDCNFLGIFCTGSDTIQNELAPLIFNVVDVAIILVGIVATIFFVYAGYKYIISAGSEEAAAQAKRQLLYGVIGIGLSLSAYAIADAINKAYSGQVDQAAVDLFVRIVPLWQLALYLVGTIATIYLVYAGYKYINSQGDPESATAARRQIVYAVIGIIVVAGAWTIANVFYNVANPPLSSPLNPGLGSDDLVNLIRAPINAALVLVSIAAAAYIILAGVMYFSSQGDEQRAAQAKQQIIYGVIGIVVVMLSAAIVNFAIVAAT